MLNKNNNRPVKVGILEISSQNKSILEFFFESAGKSLFKEVSTTEAEAFIIDYDFPSAKESWETTFNTTGKPGIILSIHEVSLPTAIWVPKPLTAKALTEAGQKLKEIVQDYKQEKEKTNAKKSLLKEKIPNTETTAITPKVLQASSISPSESKELKPETPIEILDDTCVENFDLTTNYEIGASDPSKTDTLHSQEANPDKVDVNSDIEFIPQEVMNFSIPHQTNEPSPPDRKLPESIDFLSLQHPNKTPKEAPHKIKEPTNSKEPSRAKTAKPKTKDELVLQRDVSVTEKEKTQQESDSLTPFNGIGADSEISNQDPVKKKAPGVETSIENDVAINDKEIDALLESLISGKGTKSSDKTNNNSPAPQLKELKPTTNKDKIPLEDSAIELPRDLDSDLIEENEQRSTEDIVTSPEESFANTILEVSSDGATLSDDQNSDSLEADTVAPMNPKSKADTLISGGTDTKIATKKNVSLNKQAKKSITSQQPSLQPKSTTSQPSADSPRPDTAKANNSKPEKTNATVVTKAPLSDEEELQRLLDEIRKEADIQPMPEDASVSQATIFTKKRRELIFGDWPIINKSAELKKISFKPEEHILQVFMQVLDQAKVSKTVMRLKFNKIIIVIDIQQEAIYCDFSLLDEEYAEICFNSIDPNIIKIHTLDKSEIRLYRKKMIDERKNTHSFEAFIWITSLLTARGRLPENTDINQQTGIKYWPNLTRLELFPHAIQIAAVLKKHPGSLLEIPKWLNLPQSAVFAFYNGALALGILEKDQRKLKSLKKFNQQSNNKNRGFFSRLLKRIAK